MDLKSTCIFNEIVYNNKYISYCYNDIFVHIKVISTKLSGRLRSTVKAEYEYINDLKRS